MLLLVSSLILLLIFLDQIDLNIFKNKVKLRLVWSRNTGLLAYLKKGEKNEQF